MIISSIVLVDSVVDGFSQGAQLFLLLSWAHSISSMFDLLIYQIVDIFVFTSNDDRYVVNRGYPCTTRHHTTCKAKSWR